MTEPDAVREAVELALTPPPSGPTTWARRVVRQMLLRAGRAHARHQQQIDRGLLSLIASLGDQTTELHESLDDACGEIEALRRSAQNDMIRTHGVRASVEELRSRIAELQAEITELREATAPPPPEALSLERFDAGKAGRVIGYRHVGSAVTPEQDYLAFEEFFRMSEDVIRERQRPYIAMLEGRQPVLDLGCGRGEFLELLRDAGIRARGVDLDPGMVARARAKGLDVEHADAVVFLDGLDDGSLGAAFAAQLVEHLPYPRLLALLRLVHQKLAPGGLLIAETVNPHSPTALKNFWIDLTHQHPVFPEVLLIYCRGIGFSSAYIFHPGGSGDANIDRRTCGDYAVFATRSDSVA